MADLETHPDFMIALERARDARTVAPDRPPLDIVLEVRKELMARMGEDGWDMRRALLGVARGISAVRKGGSP